MTCVIEAWSVASSNKGQRPGEVVHSREVAATTTASWPQNRNRRWRFGENSLFLPPPPSVCLHCEPHPPPPPSCLQIVLSGSEEGTRPHPLPPPSHFPPSRLSSAAQKQQTPTVPAQPSPLGPCASFRFCALQSSTHTRLLRLRGGGDKTRALDPRLHGSMVRSMGPSRRFPVSVASRGAMSRGSVVRPPGCGERRGGPY